MAIFLLGIGMQAAQWGAFTDLGQHADLEAQGGAVVTAAGFGIGSNPASLSANKRSVTTTGGTLELGAYQLFSLELPSSLGNLAVAYSRFDLSGFGLPYSEKVAELAFARSFAKWNLGLGLKLYQAGGDFADEGKITAGGYGLDLGLSRTVLKNLTFGLLLRDSISQISWKDQQLYKAEKETRYALPRELSLGAGYTVNATKFSVDLVDLGGSNLLRAGVEQALSSWLDLRVGYDGTGPTAGLGLRLGAWQFDYCYGISQLGTQRISTHWNF